MKHWLFAIPALSLAVSVIEDGSARAELVLSQVVVDLPAERPREDIEALNSGSERIYISVDPHEIIDGGTESEERIPADDPQQSGILVSPRKMILEPGERRNIRVAYVGASPASDRVFRLAVKPVSGPVIASSDALKIFVGYDALVIVRPMAMHGEVEAERSGRTLTLRNDGNTSRAIFDGRQCDASGANCRELPAKRLYPGASWNQVVPYDTVVTYSMTSGAGVQERKF